MVRGMTEETSVTPESEQEPRRILTAGQRARLLLALGAIVCYVIFWWLGALFHVPDPGYGASLLVQLRPALDIAVTGLAVLAAVAAGSLVAGTIRFDAGLFCACVGMIALSSRGGTVRAVLQYAKGPEVYSTFIGELVLLYVLIGLGWGLEWLLHRIDLLKADRFRDGLPDLEHPLGEKIMACVTQIAIMAVLMYFMAVTDKKNQVLAAVGLSSFLATAAAHLMFPVRPSVWFWVGPLVVGIIGYAVARTSPNDWIIGVAANPLANALPLDYASAGPAGAIFGYWMSRRWKRDREAMEE